MIIPGTEHVQPSGRQIGVMYCHLHQQYLNKDQPFWIIAEGDYHLACPECYSEVTGGGKRCEAVETEQTRTEVIHKLEVIGVCKIRNCTGSKKAWVKCESCLTPLCIQCARLDAKSSKYYCEDHKPKINIPPVAPSPTCELCKQHPTTTWCHKCARSICTGCLELAHGIAILCADCAS